MSRPSILPRIRWYHRWATVDIEWMGLTVDKPRYEGFITRAGARSRSARARKLGISMGIVPARDVRRRWHLGRHKSYAGRGGRTEE